MTGPKSKSSAALISGTRTFFGEQFVNCRPFRSHHEKLRPPPPFFEGTRTEFDATLDSCWYGRVLLLFRMQVRTDEKEQPPLVEGGG